MGYIKCFVRKEDVEEYISLLSAEVDVANADIIISLPELSDEECALFGETGTSRIYHGLTYEEFKEINDEMNREAKGYHTGVHTEEIVIYEDPDYMIEEEEEE